MMSPGGYVAGTERRTDKSCKKWELAKGWENGLAGLQSRCVSMDALSMGLMTR